MLTLEFYNLSAVLMILILVRLSLSQSGINKFLAIFLGTTLTFSIFDNAFSFLPLFFCLLTHQTESFSLFISTIFSRLKRFTTGQTGVAEEQEQVFMDKSGDQQASNPTQPERNLFSFLFSKKPKDSEGQEEKREYTVLPLPTQSEWESLAGVGNSFVGFLERYSCVYIIIHRVIPTMGHVIASCKETREMRYYGAAGGIGIGLFAISLLHYSEHGRRDLGVALDSRIATLYEEAQVITESAEVESARARFKSVLAEQVIYTNCMSDQFVRVTPQKKSEFTFGVLKDINTAIEKNEVGITLDAVHSLPPEKKDHLFHEVRCLSSLDQPFLLEHCYPVYRTMYLMNRVLIDREGLEKDLLTFTKEKSESSFIEGTDSKAIPYFSEKSQFGALKLGDRTLQEFALERIDSGKIPPITPGHSADQSYFTPTHVHKHDIRFKTQQTDATTEWLQGLLYANTQHAKIQRHFKARGNVNEFATIETHLKEAKLDDNSLFSKQDKSSVVQAGKGPKDQPDSSSGQSFSGHWSASPAEQNLYYCIEKTKYWANLGGCTAAVVGISEIALRTLRKLECTQVLVKRFTDKGYPHWMFFFITSSNVEQLSEKRLLHSMICILLINFLLLFMLFNLF